MFIQHFSLNIRTSTSIWENATHVWIFQENTNFSYRYIKLCILSGAEVCSFRKMSKNQPIFSSIGVDTAETSLPISLAELFTHTCRPFPPVQSFSPLGSRFRWNKPAGPRGRRAHPCRAAGAQVPGLGGFDFRGRYSKDSPNFEKLVLRCIEANFCEAMLILQHLRDLCVLHRSKLKMLWKLVDFPIHLRERSQIHEIRRNFEENIKTCCN